MNALTTPDDRRSSAGESRTTAAIATASGCFCDALYLVSSRRKSVTKGRLPVGQMFQAWPTVLTVDETISDNSMIGAKTSS